MQRAESAILICFTLMLASVVAHARDLYVSPTGSPAGDGSRANPLDLATALSSTARVQPGDTVWLLGGTYLGPFTKPATPSGTAEAPIIYRAMPGERPIISAAETVSIPFTTYASHVWYWGLEFSIGGTAPTSRGDVLHIFGGDGVRAINLVIHDNPNRSGIGAWDVGDDHEIYGCLLYRNGIFGDALAHGIYTQNTARHTTKKVIDCLIFNNFGFGVHCYGQAPALANYLYEGVVAFGNGLPPGDPNQKSVVNFLVGGLQNADNIVVRDCFTYFPSSGNFKRGADFGYTASANVRLDIQRCRFIGGADAIWLRQWLYITFCNNVCYTANGAALNLFTTAGFDPGQSSVDFNTYYRGPYVPFRRDGTPYDTIEAWRAAMGWDQNSQLVGSAPAERWMFLRPNLYEPDRAHLIIYNWPRTPTVVVDLGALWGLRLGERYAILNVEDIWGTPAAQGTYDGTPVTLPMTGAYAPEFACYLVTKVPEEFSLTLGQGWNLISIPVELKNPHVDAALPPGSVEVVWEHNQAEGYRPATHLLPKKGYWVKTATARTVSLRGLRPADKSVSLQAGWNLIGPVGPSAAQSWQPLPPTPPCTAIWEYQPVYRVPRTRCEDGRGFWVQASQATSIW